MDSILDRLTMYRVVLYSLAIMIGVAMVFGSIGWLPYSSLAILGSTVFLVVMCWATNGLFEAVFSAPSNPESSLITALILALIFTPAVTAGDYVGLGFVAMVAIASKYILAIGKKHIFNPAAMAAVVAAFWFGNSASWWAGTTSMAVVVGILGWMVVIKVRREKTVLAFMLTVILLGIGTLYKSWSQILMHSSFLFFSTIMLTEPLTMPTMSVYQIIFGVLVGTMYVPQFHIGGLYFTPELALVCGNLFAYIVSPKQKLVLKLAKKIEYSPTMFDYIFEVNSKIKYLPGQYMEWTLAHEKSDSRGIRRYFTLASSPTESDIRVGVKFFENGSSFKKAMQKLDEEKLIVATQLAGDFVLPEDSQKKLVFVAGGIGITPFRSMLKFLVDKKQQRDIVLLYSNKTESEVAYKDVFDDAEKVVGLRSIYHTTTSQGRINSQSIENDIPDYKKRMFYISGPHQFVEAVHKILKELGLSNKQIKTDYFPGLA
jgi:glycine betaine catabolism B